MIGGEREVVKLSLGEGQRTLNVIPVGLEGETLTLVCPFPVLPLDLPVSVTLPGEEGAGPVSAVIRRVGVEMMGENELPRFKLQLTIDSRAGYGKDKETLVPIVVQAIAPEPEQDDDEEEVEDDSVEEVETAAAEETEERSPSKDDGLGSGFDTIDDSIATDRAEISWSQGEGFDWPDPAALASDSFAIEPDELSEPGDVPLDFDDDDPPWVDGDFDLPTTEATPQERSTRWPTRLAVSLAFIISILAMGYVMRQPLIEAIEPVIGEELSLAILGLGVSPADAARPAIDPLEEVERATTTRVVAEEQEPAENAAPANEQLDDALALGEEIDEEPLDELDELGNIDETADDESNSADDPSIEQTDDYLRVMLPTRWPVTTASSYRLNDPPGIVVDVPGGMASERARWIDTSNERVRSVRVLERQDGVRFVIYLNDEIVPRYRVGYSRGGVTVDLMGPDPRHTQEPLVAQITP
jgi:hypothetical protein